MTPPDRHEALRDGVRAPVAPFDSRYWQAVDEARAYPEAFVEALTRAGWLSALIPEAYGGAGLSLTEACVIMEEINRAGGNAGAARQSAGGCGRGGSTQVVFCWLRGGQPGT